MQKKEETFEQWVRRRLWELDWKQNRLIEQVRKQTGLYLDTGYLSKIFRGRRKAPRICAAIRELLEQEP